MDTTILNITMEATVQADPDSDDQVVLILVGEND